MRIGDNSSKTEQTRGITTTSTIVSSLAKKAGSAPTMSSNRTSPNRGYGKNKCSGTKKSETENDATKEGLLYHRSR